MSPFEMFIQLHGSRLMNSIVQAFEVSLTFKFANTMLFGVEFSCFRDFCFASETMIVLLGPWHIALERFFHKDVTFCLWKFITPNHLANGPTL